MGNEVAERYSWGDFVLDVNRRTLTVGAKNIKLSGIPFDVLVLLVRNHNRMWSKEEIFETVWHNRSDTIFDPNLVERAISTIRSAGGETHPLSQYLRVERRRGIIFDAPVERVLPESQGANPSAPRTEQPTNRVWPRVDRWQLWFGTPMVLVGLLILYWFTAATGAPRLADPIPLTTSGTPKLAPLILLEKPHRILFTEFIEGHYQVSWVEPRNRSSGKLLTNLPSPTVIALSPDGKTLLLRNIVGSVQDDGPLFLQSVDGGVAKPLGIVGYDGAWAPDGTWMALTRNGSILRYDLPSGKIKEIAQSNGYAWWPKFSPNGTLIRFTVLEGHSQVNSLWDLDLNTLTTTRLSSETGECAAAAAGSWSSNGKDFFFHCGQGSGPFTIWWMPGPNHRFLTVKPQRLTTGPSNFRAPQPDSSSRYLFARGQLPRSEMVSVNLSSGSTELVMPDTFAAVTSYSDDGTWVIYYSTNPEQALWKCTAAGASRQLLIPYPTQSSMPQWSKDGTKIVVSTRYPGEVWHLTIISAKDGSREDFRNLGTNAISPSWSPDGKEIIFGTIPAVEKEQNVVGIYLLNVLTKKVSLLSGSTGMYMPAWSPDGRFIAAITAETNRLMIFDVREKRWLATLKDTAAFVIWTKDSSGVMFVNHDGGQGLSVRQCDIPDMKTHTLQTLNGFKQFSTWIGMRPDGSFLIPRDLSTQEIYQLEIK